MRKVLIKLAVSLGLLDLAQSLNDTNTSSIVDRLESAIKEAEEASKTSVVLNELMLEQADKEAIRGINKSTKKQNEADDKFDKAAAKAAVKREKRKEKAEKVIVKSSVKQSKLLQAGHNARVDSQKSAALAKNLQNLFK